MKKEELKTRVENKLKSERLKEAEQKITAAAKEANAAKSVLISKERALEDIYEEYSDVLAD